MLCSLRTIFPSTDGQRRREFETLQPDDITRRVLPSRSSVAMRFKAKSLSCNLLRNGTRAAKSGGRRPAHTADVSTQEYLVKEPFVSC